MAKRRSYRRYRPRFRRRSHRGGMTLPIAPLVGLAVGIAPSIPYFVQGDFNQGVDWLKWAYLGLEKDTNRFNVAGLMSGTIPLTIGLLVHKLIGGRPIGANAMLAKAKVPLIRI